MQHDSGMALSRVNLRESLVMPQTAEAFVSALTQFAATPTDQAEKVEASARVSLEQAYGYSDQGTTERKPFVYQDGVAIIPIHGALLNRFAYSWGFVTGYNAIRRQMNAALEDDDVTLIVYDVDSPGGQVAGCFELAEEMRAAREIKPSLAMVDSLSASAGYALASAASRMFATPSSRIGSIGVLQMHVDVSGALDQAGIKVTMIEAPEEGLKTAGYPYKPLSDEARADFQNSVNLTYEDFVAIVVANRGMEDAAVRDTKARVFRAQEALALGLIDAVKTSSEAVSSFLAELANDEPDNSEDDEMNTKTGTIGTSAAAPAAAAPAAATEATSTAAAPAAAAPAAAAPDAGAIQAAIREDRQRMAGIKALPEAATLPKFADHLATAGYSVVDAEAALKAAVADLPTAAAPGTAPAAAGVDTTNHLATAMDNTKQPEVGAGTATAEAPGGGGEPTASDKAKAILGDHSAATGFTYSA